MAKGLPPPFCANLERAILERAYAIPLADTDERRHTRREGKPKTQAQAELWARRQQRHRH